MASSKKIIVVGGATGNQGSSVAHTFLKLPEWHVRCLTRNSSSPASLALVALGAEVIQADLSDALSLPPAFSNATAAFLNTDFWETYRSKELKAQEEAGGKSIGEAAFDKEVLCGKNFADAAAAVPTLERIVYSSFPPMKKVSEGKYGSYHYNGKATIAEYILKKPELAKKASFIYLGAYNTNALLNPKIDPASGKASFVLPLGRDVKMPVIDPQKTTGPLVRALVEDEEAGTHLLAYDRYLTIGEMIDGWAKENGKEANHMQVTTKFLNQSFGLSTEVTDSVDFIQDYGYMGGVEKYIEPPQLKKWEQIKASSEAA